MRGPRQLAYDSRLIPPPAHLPLSSLLLRHSQSVLLLRSLLSFPNLLRPAPRPDVKALTNGDEGQRDNLTDPETAEPEGGLEGEPEEGRRGSGSSCTRKRERGRDSPDTEGQGEEVVSDDVDRRADVLLPDSSEDTAGAASRRGSVVRARREGKKKGHLCVVPSLSWKSATRGMIFATPSTTATSSERRKPKTLREARRTSAMTVARARERKIDVCAASLADEAQRAPRRLPTRVVAATPRPKGIVLMS